MTLPATDLRDAITLHQLQLQAEGRSPNTARQYFYYEKLYLGWLEQCAIQPTLSSLNASNVFEFMNWYRSQSGRTRVRNGEVAVRAARDILKRLGQVLEDMELVASNPLAKVKRPKVTQVLRQPFSQAELVALHAAARQSRQPVRNEAIFLLLLACGQPRRGLRPGC